jgi:hypothetical protein
MGELLLGRLDQAVEDAQQGREVMRRSHDWAELSLTLGTLVSVSAVRGNFRDAEQYAYEAWWLLYGQTILGAAQFLPTLAYGAMRGALRKLKTRLKCW